jgi:chromate reductase
VGSEQLRRQASAVIGASIGAIGTAVAQQHLRSILSFLASPELSQPEAYIHLRDGLITDDGEVTDESTAEFLVSWLKAVHTHVAKSLSPAE